MRVAGYRQFGGRHHDTAAMTNLLAHAGVVAPHTNAPLSEALILGVAGGIAAGYAFSPSIPSQEAGSGVSVVGRYRANVTGPEFHQGAFSRLSVATDLKEAVGARQAWRNLEMALEAGKPVLTWISSEGLPYVGWSGTYGMYSLVVFGIDLNAGLAWVGDRMAGPWEMSLEDLELARKRVCSHRNRVMTITPPRELSADVLRKAVLEGISLCVRDLLVPKVKTWNLPGLLDWARVIASPSNKRGWLTVYSDGNFYPPMRDIFDSIETAGTGGQLFRPMYAEFLEEASELTGKSALRSCAARYREAGKLWQNLADAFLPEEVEDFRSARMLLRERTQALALTGAELRDKLTQINTALAAIEERMLAQFPFSEPEMEERLSALAGQIEAIYDAECDAAEQLERAILP